MQRAPSASSPVRYSIPLDSSPTHQRSPPKLSPQGILREHRENTRYPSYPRSILVTANQPFGEWNKIFPDPAMTLAAVDRLVHHSTIFELNVESYRRRTAIDKSRGPGRPATRATSKTTRHTAAYDITDQEGSS